MSTTNYVSGLSDFRAAWDKAKARKRSSASNKVSAEGHVNLDGDEACPAAAIYTPADEEFFAAVEPGVRPLVMHLIDALDCITYTSCEGHAPTADGWSPRRVGILPRDAADYTRIYEALDRAVKATKTDVDPRVVELRIVEHTLASEGPDLPCIIVLFDCSTDWAAYVEKVDSVMNAFLDALKATPTG